MNMALSPIIIVVLLLVVAVILSLIGRARKKQLASEGTLDSTIEENTEGQSKTMLWFKRLGFAGFMFFLIKGIVWLFIFYYAGKSM